MRVRATAPLTQRVFNLGVGYHSATWVDLSVGASEHWSPGAPDDLKRFLQTVDQVSQLTAPDYVHGAAFCRIIDGARPENDLLWHRDNLDGGIRFHTAIATDDAQVNLAFIDADAADKYAGRAVRDTLDVASYVQPPNGAVAQFTTDVHGVLPQPPRPGEFTAVFFATLYESREAADLYTTNCFVGDGPHEHAILPTLETTRRVS